MASVEDEERLKEHLPEIVAHVKVAAEWSTVDESTISATFIAAGAFSAVYKVSSPGRDPLAVRLDKTGNTAWSGVGGKQLGLRKCIAFRNECQKAGITPTNLAGSDDLTWSVNECAGPSLSQIAAGTEGKLALDLCKQVGELLAKCHLIPIDWFEPFRKECCNMYPRLEIIPHNSQLWSIIATNLDVSSTNGIIPQLLELEEDAFKSFLAKIPSPRTDIARRVVSSHNDFWTSNVVVTMDGKGLQLVDFARACVQPAVGDLWQMTVGLGKIAGLPGKTEFMKGYLSTMEPGKEVRSDYIEEVLLDVESCFMCRWKNYNGARQAAQNLIDALALGKDDEVAGWCEAALALIEEAQKDPEKAKKCLGDSSGQGFIPKEMVQGKPWSMLQLISSRCGRQDDFSWFTATSDFGEKFDGTPPPFDKLA